MANTTSSISVLKTSRFFGTLLSVVHSFKANNSLLRASALSYTTVLSMVPFLALAFALLKGFDVPNRVAPMLLEKVAAGSEDLVEKIITYINNTNMKSLGAIGLVTLLFTVIGLIGEIESAFNSIWGIKEPRPWSRKFSDYLSIVIIGPFLLAAATSITTTLQSQTIVKTLLDADYIGNLLLILFKFIPYFSIWAALSFVYIFLPNSKVRIKSGIIGGIIAGTAWQIAQWCYINAQMYMSGYNAIYGTMAILPIFMIWIYTSWIIVLMGMQIVCLHQNGGVSTISDDIERSMQVKESAALSICKEITGRFRNKAQAPDADELAAILKLPLQYVLELLQILKDIRIISADDSDPKRWMPAVDPSSVTVGELLEKIYEYPVKTNCENSGSNLSGRFSPEDEIKQTLSEVSEKNIYPKE